jgi:hypothetical protein
VQLADDVLDATHAFGRAVNSADSPNDALLSILPTIHELSQPVLVDGVNLLADGTSRLLGVL